MITGWYIKDNKGFTLVEVLIAMVTSGILAIAILAYLSIGVNDFRRSETETTVIKENQIVTNKILNKLRGAKNYRILHGNEVDALEVITGRIDDSRQYHETDYVYIIYKDDDKGVYIYNLGDTSDSEFIFTEADLLNRVENKNNLLSGNNFEIQVIPEEYDGTDNIGVVITNRISGQSTSQSFNLRLRNTYEKKE